MQHLLAAEGEQLPRQQRGPVGGLADLVQVALERRAGRRLVERERRVAADRGQHVVEVVGDAAGEPADRLELLALAQLLLELALLGHVLRHADHVARLAVAVADERRREPGDDGRAGLRHEARFAAVRVPFAPDQLCERLIAGFDVLRMPEARRQPAHHLLLGVAEHRLGRAVRGENAPFAVEEHDRRRSCGKHRPEALLALAQERHRRERTVREGEGGDQHRQDPGVEHRERADRDPEPGQDELHREAGRGEQPALAKRVPAPEPQHHGQEQVVDGDEDDCGGQTGGGEAAIAVDPDEIGGEPGGQGAQHVIGEVEQPDVPGVAVADPLRDDDREHEWDEQRRREHEGAGDDERRRRMQAVVAADRDAEERRERRKRDQDRRAPPLVARRNPLAQRCGGGDEREPSTIAA